MTTIAWHIERLDCIPQTEAGQQNYVSVAYWRCNGTLGEYIGTNYGSTSFPVEQVTEFKVYEDLTEEEVLDWVWENGVNKTSVENAVKQQINAQKTPPIITPPLPWRAKRNAAQPNPGVGQPPTKKA